MRGSQLSRQVLKVASRGQRSHKPAGRSVQTGPQDSVSFLSKCVPFYFKLICFCDRWYQISELEKGGVIPQKQPIEPNITNSFYILLERVYVHECVHITRLPLSFYPSGSICTPSSVS